MILSLLWGEVCWISGSFGAMNGIEETYSRSQPVLDSFLSLVLQFSAMIEGKVESNLSAQPAKAKTKFLFFYVGRLDSFRSDIDYFSGQCGKVDLLFTFLVGNTSKYAIQRLMPVSAFPMHAFGREYLYQGAALELGKANPPTKMVCGEFQGDRYVYKKGRISR